MEKLKNLKLNKKYINKCDKQVFLDYIEKNKIECSIKKIVEGKIIFLTNYQIKDNNIETNNRIRYHFKYTFLKHITGIISLLICVIILMFAGNFIRKISFVDNSKYHESVYQDVLNHLIKKGPFFILDDTPTNISNELRQKYSEFAWIGITRNYSEILIDIEYQDVPSVDKPINNKPCDLISGYDAVITDIVVENGVVMVMKNQSVKKGDLLVSGNLLIENNAFDQNKLISSTGVIIGKTLILEKKQVLKKEENLEFTGRIKEYKRVVLFNKDIGKTPVAFDNYYTKITPVFNFFNIFKIVKISYYEEALISRIYDKENAIEFSTKQIYHDFEMYKTSSLEKIDNIKLIDVEEFEDYYEISYVVSKYINIAVKKYY